MVMQLRWGDLMRDAAGANEYEQMLKSNGGPALPKSSLCLYETFEQSARSDPYRTAVVAHDKALTYAALDETANVLADHLRLRLGVGKGSFVPLCFEKSSLVICRHGFSTS
jgi:non-ribosomal peptide synthetase component F